MPHSRLLLAVLLQLLAVVYATWFYGDRHYPAVLLMFCLPPVLLMAGVLLGRRTAAFWAGVFALFWFSHAVMVAWADPVKATFAWGGIVLSVGIVVATSWPALAKRFGRKG